MTQTQTVTPHQKRLDIQGLRCIAVLAVVLFHAHHAILPGGYVGVDIFFVLSGYLITGTLLRPMEAGTYSIKDFYRRRIRRLFPALFTVLTAVLILGLLIFPPPFLLEQLESQFFTMLFLSNFYFEDNTGYFELDASLMPLLHTWSLGVEEQFYLLFPPILYAVYRFARKALWPILFVLAIASLIYSQTVLAKDVDVAFYFPFSRAFELLIGALCVGLERHLTLKPIARQALSGIGMIAIAVSLTFISQGSPFPGVLALLPTLGTAAVILSAGASVNKVISAKPLVWVGDISYSLYLWHWPLLVFSGFLFPGNIPVILLALAVSFVLADLSYRFIEQPYLRKMPKFIFWKAAAITAGSIAVCVAIYYSDGLPQRFTGQSRILVDAFNDYNKDRPRCHMRGGRPMPYEDMCLYGAPDVAASWIVLGDSHGAELAKVLGERLGVDGHTLKSSTMSGCPAVLTRREGCTRQIVDTIANVIADPDIHTVVLSANVNGEGDYARETAEGVARSARELSEAGKRVIIIYPLPSFDFDPPSYLAVTARMGGDITKIGMSREAHDAKKALAHSVFDPLTQNTDGIYGVNTTEIFCKPNFCHVWDADVGTYYYNKNHISLTGAAVLTDVLIDRFAD